MRLEVVGFDTFACVGFQERVEEPQRPEGLEENIELADDFSGGQVDILMGTDQYYKVVLRNCVVLDESLRALDTIFGYVIHGKSTSSGQPIRHVYHCRQVEQMWDLDSIAEDENGVSLNEYLEPGENPLSRLVEVLLNFRTYPIACQADIQAAFHQIAVKEEDRRYLQLILKNKTLRFQRVPFGLTCSPYMLLRSIQMHLSLYKELHSELCRKLAAGLYMDDIAIGFATVEEASTQMDVVQNIFREASMKMHKMRLTVEPSEDSKILGMKWNTERDNLAVTIPTCSSPKTKSQLLSVIAKPFDPIGVLDS
ncbi:hypothetical protein FJT64_018774 [Amphibalanus amphitrite]|uniref:Reverse transcriptase domain-containing protein n=1 Tax=Amphibalanus amphitrite TaxID=1232801 RepID=A0A6A4WXV3_AMPAM|nr:hypothetical protein FJT64_018774 [Amphibalanus amphitrite]